VTIAEAAKALRSREVSSAELTKQCLDQIAKLNPVLNAFITVTDDSALARARELDRELGQGIDRGPLHGIPIAHKDLMWTKDVRTTSGSRIFADGGSARRAVLLIFLLLHRQYARRPARFRRPIVGFDPLIDVHRGHSQRRP